MTSEGLGIRDRLIRAVHELGDNPRKACEQIVDAILGELEKPDEGMIEAGDDEWRIVGGSALRSIRKTEVIPPVFTAMIRHIRKEE